MTEYIDKKEAVRIAELYGLLNALMQDCETLKNEIVAMHNAQIKNDMTTEEADQCCRKNFKTCLCHNCRNSANPDFWTACVTRCVDGGVTNCLFYNPINGWISHGKK